MRSSALWADLQVGQEVGRVALYQHIEHLILEPLRPRQNWSAQCAAMHSFPPLLLCLAGKETGHKPTR